MSPQGGGTEPSSNRLIAEFRVAHPDFPLMETLSSGTDLHIRSQFQPGTTTTAPEKYFVIESSDFEAVERAAREDPTVEEIQVLTRGDRQRTYRVEFTEDTFLLSPHLVDLPVQIDAIDKAGDRWLFRLVADDREAMMRALDRAKNACADYSLDRLFSPESPDDASTVELTATQRETLRLAYAEGYFEVPRQTSLVALGELLEVSDSAVSARLRGGLSSLLEQTLDVDESGGH